MGLKIVLYLLLLFISAPCFASAKLTDLCIKNNIIYFNVNQPVNYAFFFLNHPNRFVVDIQNTQYALAKSSDLSGTVIQHFRYGIQQNNNLRLVFDLKKPDKNLQVDFNFPKLIPPVPAYSSHHKFIVIIDAGHGGKDPGTIGNHGILEKNVTLAIANDLKKLVNQQPDMKTVMTRHGNYYVGLRQRLMIARKAHGDIFIAIHADAFPHSSAEGASVFGLSLHGASSEAALWLAKKENYSELDGIDLNTVSAEDTELRTVLIDLSQSATIGASLQLGQDVLKNIGEITTLHHDSVEQAPFMVLKSPDIPSILVETGFLSNPEEESRLKSKSYQEKIAHALMSGIMMYFHKTAPSSVLRRTG